MDEPPFCYVFIIGKDSLNVFQVVSIGTIHICVNCVERDFVHNSPQIGRRLTFPPS